MNKIIIVSLLVLMAMSSCGRHDVIDDTFKWPKSGIEEADSILLLFENNRTSLQDNRLNTAYISEFCSLAQAHENNKILQTRKLYLSSYNQDTKQKAIEALKEKYIHNKTMDGMPYDQHMVNSILIENESNYLKRYNMILENMSYFQKIGAEVEYCRQLVLLGNLMIELKDSVKALMAYNEADDIALKYKLLPNHITISLNKAVASPRHISDSIYKSLRESQAVKKYPNAYIQLMQNSFVITDSLTFLDNAIAAYMCHQPLRHTLPVLLALKGDYYTRHGNPQLGLKFIQEAFDSIGQRPYLSRYVHAMHYYKAQTWMQLNEKDSALVELSKTIFWADSMEREYNRSKIYALDAKSSIELTERNASLKRTKIIYLWIISSLILIIIILGGVFMHKKLITKKRRKEERLEEDLRKNHQSILLQSSMMEQTNNLINAFEGSITKLSETGVIEKESADLLMRELRLHKSSEEYREGCMKMQRELDTRFMTKLKNDFPNLTENQLRLASLIAVGVDSRQIGSILNIENASVHTGRWRLRKRLGLAPEDSLEDFLRRYNNQ